MAPRGDRPNGFTIMELMIVVAIIGILAAVAIPAYQNSQNKSRRAEALGNISAIAKLEQSYMAEFNNFVAVPVSQPGGGLGPSKRDWTVAANAAFGTLGFRPDGDVYYDYEVNVDVGVCPGQDCFTATAYGDADGNGLVAMIQYVQPSPGGAFATSILFPGNGIPQDPISAASIFNAAAVNYNADLY